MGGGDVLEGACRGSLLTQEGCSESPWNPDVEETGSSGPRGMVKGEIGQEPGRIMGQAPGPRKREQVGRPGNKQVR